MSYLKKLSMVGALIASACLLSVGTATSASAEGYRVKRLAKVVGVSYYDRLNIRAWPSKHSRRVGAIPSRARRVFVKRCIYKDYGSDWCKVVWRGQVGWVNKSYLRVRHGRGYGRGYRKHRAYRLGYGPRGQYGYGRGYRDYHGAH